MTGKGKAAEEKKKAEGNANKAAREAAQEKEAKKKAAAEKKKAAEDKPKGPPKDPGRRIKMVITGLKITSKIHSDGDTEQKIILTSEIKYSGPDALYLGQHMQELLTADLAPFQASMNLPSSKPQKELDMKKDQGKNGKKAGEKKDQKKGAEKAPVKK